MAFIGLCVELGEQEVIHLDCTCDSCKYVMAFVATVGVHFDTTHNWMFTIRESIQDMVIWN